MLTGGGGGVLRGGTPAITVLSLGMPGQVGRPRFIPGMEEGLFWSSAPGDHVIKTNGPSFATSVAPVMAIPQS